MSKRFQQRFQTPLRSAVFIAEGDYGLENSDRSGVPVILAARKAVESHSVSHITLLAEFAKRKRTHGYKHFIPSGIKTRISFDDETLGWKAQALANEAIIR